MQYNQPSEFSDTHWKEGGIPKFNRSYKTNYESSRISTRHEYTDLEANPDHPYTARQRGGFFNSYKQPSKFNETRRNESKISEFGRPYTTFIGSDRISNKHKSTKPEVNPDHPHTARQGAGVPELLQTNTRV